MKFYILLPLISLCCYFSMTAQQPLRLSLSQARQLAVSSQLEYQNNKITQQTSLLQLQQAHQKYYPQVGASYDLRANLLRPTNILPGTLINSPNDIAVQFGTLWNSTLGIEVTQVLYDKTLQADIKVLESSQKIADIQTETKQQDWQLAATKAYFQVLIHQERVRQQDATIARLAQHVQDMSVKVKAQLCNDIELQRLQNSYQNALIERDKWLENLVLAEQTLNYLLGQPLYQTLVLSDSLSSIEMNTAVKNPVSNALDMAQFAEYRLAQAQLLKSDAQILKQKANLMPTVNAYGYLAGQSLMNDFSNIPMYGIAYLGLRVAWRLNPIFENKVILPQLDLQKQQQQNNIQQLENNLQYQVNQAWSTYNNSQRDRQKTTNDLALANKELNYIATRYRADLATANELNEAERNINLAQIADLLAAYQVAIAYWEWKKANGL